MDNAHFKNRIMKNISWKLLENFGVQFVGFTIQIVLARLLLPEDYGVIAISSILIAISNVIISTGFSSSIIQKSDLNNDHLNSIFFVNIAISLIEYVMLYFVAPMISELYSEPILINVIRIQSITLLIGSFSSVHDSILIRDLDFHKSFIIRMVGTAFQGILGIFLAIKGFGIWSLVYSTLLNNLIVTILTWHFVKWMPKLRFSINSIKEIYKFSLRVFLINFLNQVFYNIKSLIIGVRYDTLALGYYSRGYQIPSLILTNIDGAISSVMFSVFSRIQSDKVEILNLYRKSIKSSTYIIFPMMFGLISIARPLTIILFTEKWIDSTPFLILSSIICMTWPFNIMYHMFNSLNRSDISLKLSFFLHIVNTILIISFLNYGIFTIVLITLVGSIITIILGSIKLRKMINYSLKQQLLDVLPSFSVSFTMMLLINFMFSSTINVYFKLIFSVIFGISFYLLSTYILNFSVLIEFIELVKIRLKKETRY